MSRKIFLLVALIPVGLPAHDLWVPMCRFGFSTVAESKEAPVELIASTYERLLRELGGLRDPAQKIPESPFEVSTSAERDLGALQKSLRAYEEMLIRRGWLSPPIFSRLKDIRRELLGQVKAAETVRLATTEQNFAAHLDAPLGDGVFSPDGSVLFARGTGTNFALATTNLVTGKSTEQNMPFLINKGMFVTSDGKYLALQSNLHPGREMKFFPIEKGNVDFSAGFGIVTPEHPGRWFEILRKMRRPLVLREFADSGSAGFVLALVFSGIRRLPGELPVQLCLFDLEKRHSKIIDPTPLGFGGRPSEWSYGPVPGADRAYFSHNANGQVTLKTARVSAAGLMDVETFHTWKEGDRNGAPDIRWAKDHNAAVSFFSNSFDSLTLVKPKGDVKIGESRPNRKEGDVITQSFFSADGKHLAVFVHVTLQKNLTLCWYDLEKKQWSIDTRPFAIPAKPGPIATPDHTKLFFQSLSGGTTFIPLAP